MIKLNNKNITYVALADSNNSIKAPKEIWYADSNNSVKLVYRRKDALIEGEDYEKYHWLEGRNGAYINTIHPLSVFEDAFEIRAKIAANAAPNPDGGENDLFGVMREDGRRCICFYARGNGRLFFAYSNILSGGNQIYFENKNVFSAKMVADNSNFTVVCDGESKSASVGAFPQEKFGDGITLFQLTTKQSQNYFHGDIAYFRITDPTFTTDKLHLIPCKLLKPVPKWLDANGIRRQVGECGMIDLVSGKFYGNVNSVGTFTVENYYERKEWLVGDIPSETRCIDLPINSEEVSYTIVVSKVGNTTLFETIGNKRYYAYATNSTLRIWDITTSKNDSNDDKIDLGIQDGVILNIDSDISSFKINNIDCPKVNFPISAIVFRSGGLQSNAITQTSSITVDEVERYIPCTLTMDLPASMDANNIARKKGTSGMWDLVSDKFYGNVASSGTFKAVNLAKGVDYEVHQYLAVEMPKGYFMNLPLDSSTFSYSRIYTSIGNTAHLTSKQAEYAYFSAEMTGVGVWNGSQTTNYKPIDISNLSIVCDSNQLLFNSVEFPIYEFPPKVSFYNTSTTTNTVLKQSAITVDGIERYIPVKLLRSIPSKYDANGIARQAGECGMYDTVNDVFYGNVASSGTFSVSDDS